MFNSPVHFEGVVRGSGEFMSNSPVHFEGDVPESGEFMSNYHTPGLSWGSGDITSN